MELLTTGYGLIEGPTWWESQGLLFSDVINGGVYLLGPENETEVILQHRKGIGGIVLHEKNGIVVGGRNLSYKSLPRAKLPIFKHIINADNTTSGVRVV